MLTIQECKLILDAARRESTCIGNINAARKYYDAGDIEGFERVCRGSRYWLGGGPTRYTLTDGLCEIWYDNDQPRKRYAYAAGELDGLYEHWHANGQPFERYTYVAGKRNGLYETWYGNGQPCERYTYVAGKRNGLYERWYANNQPCERYNYVAGVRQD